VVLGLPPALGRPREPQSRRSQQRKRVAAPHTPLSFCTTQPTLQQPLYMWNTPQSLCTTQPTLQQPLNMWNTPQSLCAPLQLFPHDRANVQQPLYMCPAYGAFADFAACRPHKRMRTQTGQCADVNSAAV
jgi:hypothetical protein